MKLNQVIKRKNRPSTEGNRGKTAITATVRKGRRVRRNWPHASRRRQVINPRAVRNVPQPNVTRMIKQINKRSTKDVTRNRRRTVHHGTVPLNRNCLRPNSLKRGDRHFTISTFRSRNTENQNLHFLRSKLGVRPGRHSQGRKANVRPV